ncbi:MAG: addiction module protein [Ignavibacteriaceae bacterium]|jgi:putative addiction module component (TIGR02574 family)
MNAITQQLVDQLLQLPADERISAARQLFISIDNEIDKDSELEWEKEIQKRISELDSCIVASVPWEAVKEKIELKYHASN